MRLAFYNEYHAPYNSESLLTAPLGGTESSIAELCFALSKDHEVILYNSSPNSSVTGTWGKNASLKISNIEYSLKHGEADWFIYGAWINETHLAALPINQKVAFWTHLDPSYPIANSLAKPEVANRISLLLTVSEWQRQAYIEKFKIPPDRVRTVGNPYCERALTGPVLKSFAYPKLIYTSVPYRGLSILAYAFPMFRKVHPRAELTVITGMELYGIDDNSQYKYLLNKLQKTENVTLIKPVGKIELYKHLRESNMFVFPTHINETFCLSALEAELNWNMLCLTRTGALPEIFPNAEFFPPGILTSENWNKFMLDCWDSRNIIKKASENRNKYNPAEVAERFVHELTR